MIFPTIELIVETIKWLNIDLLRLGLARIPKDFSAGIAPHAALGHPTHRTKTGKWAIRTHTATGSHRAQPISELRRRQVLLGERPSHRIERKDMQCWTIDRSFIYTHRTYKFYRACNCFVLPSFICSSFFPYIHSSIKSHL